MFLKFTTFLWQKIFFKCLQKMLDACWFFIVYFPMCRNDASGWGMCFGFKVRGHRF